MSRCREVWFEPPGRLTGHRHRSEPHRPRLLHRPIQQLTPAPTPGTRACAAPAPANHDRSPPPPACDPPDPPRRSRSRSATARAAGPACRYGCGSPRDRPLRSFMDVLLDAWDTKPDNRIRRTSPTSTTDALEELLVGARRHIGTSLCCQPSSAVRYRRVTQAFPTQDRAPLTTVCGIVLGHDLRLVLRGEPASLRLVSSRRHAPIINRGNISQRHRHLRGTYLAPTEGTTSSSVVSHLSLTHRGGRGWIRSG